MNRWRTKLAALLFAAAFGFGIVQATPAAAAPIFSTISKDCQNWDSAASGYIRVYVDRYVDLAPNPIKSRPYIISITNHYNHSMGITDVEWWHDSDDAGPHWWNFDDMTLSYEGQGSTQSVVSSPLPRLQATNGTAFNYWWSRTGNNDSTIVSHHGPVNNPWWVGNSSDGPYIFIRATILGSTAGCLVRV